MLVSSYYLCSYILDAREHPFLSMLEMIFYKLMKRFDCKQKEVEKWTGRICPKIKKKLDKFTEWSNQCKVTPNGNYLYFVKSHEFEQDYTVDFKTNSCDCKRWQLIGISCHHAIACCRTDNINPANLVHSCYTVDTYMKAYAHKLFPLRGRVFWEKMQAAPVYPPLFTKVMGRPRRNRKKAPEEKMKQGVLRLTRAGVTMHCSVCGNPNHNKRGHSKYVEDQLRQSQAGPVFGDDEEVDIPQIREVNMQFIII